MTHRSPTAYAAVCLCDWLLSVMRGLMGPNCAGKGLGLFPGEAAKQLQNNLMPFFYS